MTVESGYEMPKTPKAEATVEDVITIPAHVLDDLRQLAEMTVTITDIRSECLGLALEGPFSGHPAADVIERAKAFEAYVTGLDFSDDDDGDDDGNGEAGETQAFQFDGD